MFKALTPTPGLRFDFSPTSASFLSGICSHTCIDRGLTTSQGSLVHSRAALTLRNVFQTEQESASPLLLLVQPFSQLSQ